MQFYEKKCSLRVVVLQNPRLVDFSSFVKPLLCCINVQLLLLWLIHLRESMFLLSPNLQTAAAMLFCRPFTASLSINLISTYCTRFHLFALNFNFLHCLGLIDVLSANELAETHAYYYSGNAKVSSTRQFFARFSFVYGSEI